MDIPYGFDCYAFTPNEVKFFDSSATKSLASVMVPHERRLEPLLLPSAGYLDRTSGGYIRFTRKNEDYSSEQVAALARAGRLNASEVASRGDKKIFCGIKIQLGISVVTNFLRKGLQYRRPNKGRSELVNGSWNGIVSGLTVEGDAPNSYDIAFGNFLAYDEEFPYIKFGPFFAIESKLVMLTGSARSLEASSFGTNIQSRIWFGILFFMLLLSLLASLRVKWQHTKHRKMEALIGELIGREQAGGLGAGEPATALDFGPDVGEQRLPQMLQNFFFIYFTMLLNKPSLEFDDFIWPKHERGRRNEARALAASFKSRERIRKLLAGQQELRGHYERMVSRKLHRKPLPSSIRVLSYLWSSACLVMASIYSGEMLAVILLKADQNIDTIAQLINSNPPITPVIRQDDFTYNLMLKSLDRNMLLLHNMTKIIPRPEVYTRAFIESVSERKQALLGDDELIETIYDIYHKHFPLYRSKITYLQYPISIMYRKDLELVLERKLRRGLKQVFESGLLNRWYQAQKETYINFYAKENEKNEKAYSEKSAASSNSKYKPLSMQHFESFFKLMFFCILASFVVLLLELSHFRWLQSRRPASLSRVRFRSGRVQPAEVPLETE